jgi:serine/threonine protein kinase
MENRIVSNKYKIIRKIGNGSFGEIYSGINIRTGENVAIKIEAIQNNTKLLKNEAKIYQYLNGKIGIPQVKWFGVDDVNNYMVINLLGYSLTELIKKYTRFSLKITLQLGIQIVERLKTIHTNGLIHRDIKPDNFLMSDHNTLFIIDFGLCKTYWDENRRHINEKCIKTPIGTLDFISINVHNLVEPSRRDDLESVGYILLYLFYGELEWQDNNNMIKMNNIGINDKIKNRKIEFINRLEIRTFLNYFTYVKNLSFKETPDYDYLCKILSESMSNNK